MNTNFPVGDFLIRIKNAALARNHEVVVQNTKLIFAVANALKKEGFLHQVKLEKDNLIVRLSYKQKEPVLMDLKLVSKPGLRIYMGVDDLAKLKGPSTHLLSTPIGIVTTKEALKKRVGGEVIAEIL